MSASATRTQTFIPVCCVCGLAREDGDPSGAAVESWSEFDAYLSRHGLHGTDYKLTHAYCPVCVHSYVPSKRKVAPVEVSATEAATDITGVVLQTLRHSTQCDLDTLVQACPQFTWNQIFLEVDRLSRSGDLHLTLFDRGRYVVGIPADSKIHQRM